jgi:YegS/Rv2252/BmrU family lipid kinase
MASSTIDLFINPTAGRGRAGKRLSRICELAESLDVVFSVHASRALGDLERQVQRFVLSGGSRLVVAGGDGSIHEAVNGIMTAGGDASLGVIPTGTGNDFAKAANITLDWEQATLELAKRIASRETWRRVDIGVMNERFFANGAGVGFDAKVTELARSYTLPIGDIVYLIAIFRGMIEGISTPEFLIDADGQERSGPVTLANIASGPWVGGMFHIAPDARNNDGHFDMIVADPVSRLRILQLIPKLMRGTHMNEPEISHLPVQRVRISSEEPVPSHLDGEVQPPQQQFDIRVLPNALTIL